MKKVFIYVGHSNWGKSKALKIITGNSSQRRTVQIASYNVSVSKMSNDDNGIRLLNWVKKFPIKNYDRFIIAFCPNTPPISGKPTVQQKIARDILIELQKTKYSLFFFVQKEKFNSPQDKITPQEINWLRTFGKVQILNGQNPDTTRATQFRQFVLSHI